MIDLPAPRPRRRASLTPMIDVVFLLLIFFMLASRFGTEGVVALTGGGAGAGWSGPPRLIDFSPEGVRLNGVPVAPETLPEALLPLVTDPADTLVLRPQGGASLQDLTDLTEALTRAGFTRLVLVEP